MAIGIAALGLAGLGGMYGALRHDGLSADRKPRAIEAMVARRLVNLSIPSSARDARNPLTAPDAWRGAVDDFRGSCAGCHGADGRGRTAIGPHMYPPVPDLTAPGIQSFSDGALFSIIRHGVSWTGMPAFRSGHSEEQTWRLVAFVRRLPAVTPGDLATPAEALTIVIDGTAFQPAEQTVTAGHTVTWINRDPFPHNVTAKDGAFRSPDLEPGESWSFTPRTAGTFPYVCTLHPTMAAVLRVE